MKKIIKYFMLILTLFLVLPLNTLADCGVSFVELEIKISNKEGAKVYNQDYNNNKYEYTLTGEVLNYGEKYTLQYEYGEYATIIKDNKVYTIKSSDYSYIESKDFEEEETVKYYTYAETILKNVPSLSSYEVVATIPANTVIDVIGKEYENGNYIKHDDGWARVIYNGKKGWVYFGGCGVDGPVTVAEKLDKPVDAYFFGTIKYNNEDRTIGNATEGYTILGDETTKREINIKKGDKVTIIYTHSAGHNRYQYIKTSNIDGIWVYNVAFYIPSDKKILVSDYDSSNEYMFEVKEFDTLKDASDKINNDSIYDCKYEMIEASDEYGYAIDVNGMIYWILAGRTEGTITELEKQSFELNLDKEYNYYNNSNIYEGREADGTIPSGTYQAYKVIDKYNTFKYEEYYIENYGFIEYGDSIQKPETVSPNSSRSMINPTNNYLIIIISVTVLIALLAAFLIAVLGKKRKKENELK